MSTPTREELMQVGQLYTAVEVLQDCYLKAAKRPRLTQAMSPAEQVVRLGQWRVELAIVADDLAHAEKLLEDAVAELRGKPAKGVAS